MDAYRRFWKKYATFSGRASLGEYWWATLANVVIAIVITTVLGVIVAAVMAASCTTDSYGYTSCAGGMDGFPVLMIVAYVYPLAALVPNLAVSWRRLHDTGRSGAYYFLGFIPYVGGIILVVFLAQRTRPEGAMYDVPPYGAYGQQPYGMYGPPTPGPYPYGQ